MKLFSVRGKRLASIVSIVVLGSMILAACGSANTGSSGSTPTTNGNGGKGCKKIGVSLPETASSNRWDGFDRPLLEQMIPQMLPGATVDYANAEGNADTQQTQADAMLTKGDCILVVAANDSIKAARIVADAKADGVPDDPARHPRPLGTITEHLRVPAKRTCLQVEQVSCRLSDSQDSFTKHLSHLGLHY
jgi:D-xylose transport system substrate-binding protein